VGGGQPKPDIGGMLLSWNRSKTGLVDTDPPVEKNFASFKNDPKWLINNHCEENLNLEFIILPLSITDLSPQLPTFQLSKATYIHSFLVQWSVYNCCCFSVWSILYLRHAKFAAKPDSAEKRNFAFTKSTSTWKIMKRYIEQQLLYLVEVST